MPDLLSPLYSCGAPEQRDSDLKNAPDHHPGTTVLGERTRQGFEALSSVLWGGRGEEGVAGGETELC